MKISVDHQLFDTITGLCIGVVALRAADNRDMNLEAEAFRRRCCTEANLLLKMNPAMADAEIARYDAALSRVGLSGETALSKTFKDYKKALGLSEKEEESDEVELLAAPKAATLDELAGSDMLPRENPISDIIRSAMLKFHVDIHGYDMGDRKTPLTITKTDDDIVVSLGNKTLTRRWLCEEVSENITNDTEDVLILITGFAPNRKKVAAARNELARRIKSAFDRAVEVGWLEGEEAEFETDI